MSEKELNSNNSAESLSRAEKIKAIKNSISRQENLQNNIESISDTSVNVSEPEKTFANDWEAEMSERIAERVNRLKSNRNVELLEVLNSTEKSCPSETSENTLSENISEQPYEEIREENPDEHQAYRETENVQEFSEEVPQVYSETMSSETFSENDEVSAIPLIQEADVPKKKSFKEKFLGLFPQKGDSVLEKCRKLIFMASVIAIVVCGAIVLEYYIDTSGTQHEYEEIMSGYEVVEVPTKPDKPESEIQYLMMPNAEELYKINPDVVGVINIPDTEIFYPVVKGKDNNEYLNKTITGEEARAGSIFMDYRNVFDEVVDGKMQKSSDNIVIYGHEMATGKMFGQLKQYKDNSYFYEEHPIIEFNSNYFCYKYKIFSIMIVDADDKTDTRYEYWNKLNFENEKDFYNFVNEAKRRTVRVNDVDVKYGDQILTLSTCNGIFGKDAGGRLVVMARRLRDGEDELEGTQNSSSNPNIKWPSIYYNYNGNEKYNEEDFVPYG